MAKLRAAALLLLLSAATAIQAQVPSQAEPIEPIRAVRFDPSYYYGTGMTTRQLARTLADRWARAGVNTVYFRAYDQVYGARYRTDYPHNIQEGFGDEDLLGVMLPLLKARGMKVIAWFFDHQHRGAWLARPDWRVRRPDGSYYRVNPGDYYLSVHHPEVRAYLQGFVEDLLLDYPDLDGIDITEPIVNWWGNQADFSPHTVAGFRREHPGAPLEGPEWLAYRAHGLTMHVKEMVRTVRDLGREVHVTTTFSARQDGRLLTVAQMMEETGFDLDAVLSGDDVPDVLVGEVIWQCWADAHGRAFDPAWTASGVRQALAQVAGRATFVAHVELSPFGTVTPTIGEFGESLHAAQQGGALHLDFYDTHQADVKGAWTVVRDIYGSPVLRAIVEPAALPRAE